mgnify:FL=1
MTAFEFYNRCSWKGRLLILKTLFELPAAVFHELCHIVGAVLTWSTILKVEVLYFYEVEGNTIKSYACNVTTNTKGNLLYLRCLIINIAPVLGIVGLLAIDYDFIYWIILSFKTFWLSDQDIRNARNNFKSLVK